MTKIFERLNITKPTFVIKKDRVKNNIQRMLKKTSGSGVRLRPHFKTHQNAEVGELFKDQGIHAITVSSIDMAVYFAEHGWKDITVAFPVNILQIKDINMLSAKCTLNLLVESTETAAFLGEHCENEIGIWIKINSGYNRAGIDHRNVEEILAVRIEIERHVNLRFEGILTHSGHTYNAKSDQEIREIWDTAKKRMAAVKEAIHKRGFKNILVSAGDTPGCSVVESFDGIDEVRPGNFAYYDLMQTDIWSCPEEDIACAVTCPVVAKHKERNEIITYGGAVHLSKEYILNKNGEKVFGAVTFPTNDGWGPIIDNAHLYSISQEHGKIKLDDANFEIINIGDMLTVLPVHSCLAADLLKQQVLI